MSLVSLKNPLLLPKSKSFREMEGLSEPLVNLLSEYSEYEDYVRDDRDWYKYWADRSLFWVKALGGLTLLLSTSLPVLVNLKFQLQEWVLPLMGLSIAWIAGFQALNQWQASWASRRQTELRLTSILMSWRLAMHKASQDSSYAEMQKQANLATEAMLLQAWEATSMETEKFFALMEKLKSQEKTG